MNINENQQQLVLNLSAFDDVAPIEIQPADPIDKDQLENPESVIFLWSTNLLSEKCREGDNRCIRFFVDYSRQTTGCKKHAVGLIDRLDSDTNLSPLHHAARYQQVDICFMILSNLNLTYGVNIKDSNGRTPIHLAFRSSNKTTKNIPIKEETVTPDEMFGNEIQEFDAWVEDYFNTIHTVDHPLIYLFAKANGDLNARDKYLLTPLHYAVTQNSLSGVRQLFSFHVNFEARDRQGIRPLHLACREGYLSIVEYLIEHGAEIEVSDDDRWTPLHYACARGHLKIIELLKMKNEDLFRTLIQQKTNTGATCLHLAVQHGNRLSVDYILSQFQNPTLRKLLHDQAVPFGTPLHFAAKFCDPSMIKLLFHYDVDPSVLNDQNQSSLHIACASNRLTIVQILLSYTKSSLLEIKDHQGQTALSLTTNSDIVDELLAAHADLMSTDNNSMNALMIAISKSQYVIVEHLLAAIHDDNSALFEQVEKRHHRSAFLLAVQKGSLEICTALLKHPSISWDIVDKQRMNAFHLAARYNHHEVIQLLSEHIQQPHRLMSLKSRSFSTSTNVTESEHISISQISSILQNSIDAQNEDGKTPLHIAAEFGHTSSVEILLKNHADPLLTNHVGQLPLHIAIQNGHTQCVDLLVQASKKNKNDFQAALARRQSPFNTACQNGYTNIVQLLLVHQDDLDDAINFQTQMSKNEANPLEIAIKYRQTETVHALLDHPNVKHWLMAQRKTPNDIHQTPLREMIRHMPECAKHAFDRFIVKTHEVDSWGDAMERTTFQYKFIDDYFLENGRLYGANRNQIYRNHPFIIALDCNHDALLQHPLARRLMKRKWQLYRPFFYLARLLTFLLLFILTCHILLIPAPISKTPSNYTLKFIDRIHQPIRWLILILAGINIMKIICETILYRGFRVPFAQIFSLISFLTSSIAFLPLEQTKETLLWQWQLAAFSGFLQWFNTAFILRSVPFVGNVIVLFQSVFLNFFSLTFVTLPLLIAFTFSTQMIFYDHSPFQKISSTTHKLSAMLIGELDFHGLFFSKPVLTAAPLIFFPFAMVMTIAFMNLLLGLTIGDIQQGLDDARLKARSYRIRELIYIEATLPNLSLLKSFITDQIVDVHRNDADIAEESEENNLDSAPVPSQNKIELRKLLDILNMLCTQAKQTLEKEIRLERTLKQLLTVHKAQISVQSDELNTSKCSS